MKKIKKIAIKALQTTFEPEIKSSTINISSRVCNTVKFNALWDMIDSAKDLKNQISLYCYQNLTSLVSDYSNFLTHYNKFNSTYLNAWEIQTIFHEICGHYYETASRYLSKNNYITGLKTNKKSSFAAMATFIDKKSNLSFHYLKLHDLRPGQTYNLAKDKKQYFLNFGIETVLLNLKEYLTKYKADLAIEKEEKNIEKLTKKITSYHKLIQTYVDIQSYSLKKPLLYARLLELIKEKKLNALNKAKLGVYKTGTHARNIETSKIFIVEDKNNGKYQYFLKIRKQDKLTGKTPKLIKQSKSSLIETSDILKEKLNKFNEDNFLYLPVLFNPRQLKSIGKNINTILSKDNPQILLKAEQLRQNTSSRKIQVIFKYEKQNELGKRIKQGKYIEPNDSNTLGLDVNIKHNLLVDSDAIHYSDILQSKNKSKFVANMNEIVVMQSIPVISRTEKQKYRYEKLLRNNESLLKTYLSGLIKDWKNKNILHLVLEDLNFISDKSSYVYVDKNNTEFKIKYTRLARLLRINQIKIWVNSMATKQGLFTHWVNPAYTSQECPSCHSINTLNRKKQEDFICQNKNCLQHNVKKNADEISAQNIKQRIANNKLREKLSKDNVYLCARKNSIYYREINGIIEDCYRTISTVENMLVRGSLVMFYPINKRTRI